MCGNVLEWIIDMEDEMKVKVCKKCKEFDTSTPKWGCRQRQEEIISTPGLCVRRS